MPHTAVVTDSSACLPASLIETLGINVLPITVHLPGADRLDGAADLPLQVYQALEADQPVKSSSPSVAEYLAAIEDAEADTVVIVTPAGEYTAMTGNASLACQLAGRRAHVVDSRTGAAGQALVVLAGAESAAAGDHPMAVLRAFEEASERVDQVGSLAVLAPLRRSGRVASGVLEGGGQEQVRSVFRMRRGAVEPLATVRTAEAAVDRIHAEWEQGGGPGALTDIVFHGGVPELADQLSRRLDREPLIAGFSAAMGVYTGRGVIGVAWLPPG